MRNGITIKDKYCEYGYGMGLGLHILESGMASGEPGIRDYCIG